jgi:hypothetical protein
MIRIHRTLSMHYMVPQCSINMYSGTRVTSLSRVSQVGAVSGAGDPADPKFGRIEMSPRVLVHSIHNSSRFITRDRWTAS